MATRGRSKRQVLQEERDVSPEPTPNKRRKVGKNVVCDTEKAPTARAGKKTLGYSKKTLVKASIQKPAEETPPSPSPPTAKPPSELPTPGKAKPKKAVVSKDAHVKSTKTQGNKTSTPSKVKSTKATQKKTQPVESTDREGNVKSTPAKAKAAKTVKSAKVQGKVVQKSPPPSKKKLKAPKATPSKSKPATTTQSPSLVKRCRQVSVTKSGPAAKKSKKQLCFLKDDGQRSDLSDSEGETESQVFNKKKEKLKDILRQTYDGEDQPQYDNEDEHEISENDTEQKDEDATSKNDEDATSNNDEDATSNNDEDATSNNDEDDTSNKGGDKSRDYISHDSDDELSDAAEQNILNTSQKSMEGMGQEYSSDVKIAAPILEEDKDDIGEMHVVLDKVAVQEDPNKKNSQWWADDGTAEAALCRLWAEEKSLYVMHITGHRIPTNRQTILKRFSAILQIPPNVIYTRMQSLRNCYQSMYREAKSGSSPKGSTPRQREVKRLLWFLRQHIKTGDSITTFSGESPAQRKRLYDFTPLKKSTPKDNVVDLTGDVSGTKKHIECISDKDSDDDFQEEYAPKSSQTTKKLPRNSRLGEPEVQKYLKKNTPCLYTPSKKTSDPSKVKKTAPPSNPSMKPIEPHSATSDQVENRPTTASERVDILLSSKGRKPFAPSPRQTQPKGTKTKKNAPAAVGSKKKAQEVHDTGSEDDNETDEKDGSYPTKAEPNWYQKQGPAYRKKQDEERAKNKKKTSGDPIMLNVMRDKNEIMSNMAQSMSAMSKETVPTKTDSPNQLWADSIVPMLDAMDEDTRDTFVLHFMTLAMRAKRGEWPRNK